MARSGRGAPRAGKWPEAEGGNWPPPAAEKPAVAALFRLADSVCGADRHRAQLRLQRRPRERGRLEPIARAPGAPPVDRLLAAAQAAKAGPEEGGAGAGLETYGGSSASSGRCHAGAEEEAGVHGGPPGGATPRGEAQAPACPPLDPAPPCDAAHEPGPGRGAEVACSPRARKRKPRDGLRATLQRLRRGLFKQEPILGELRNLQDVIRALAVVPAEKPHSLDSLREAYRESLYRDEKAVKDDDLGTEGGASTQATTAHGVSRSPRSATKLLSPDNSHNRLGSNSRVGSNSRLGTASSHGSARSGASACYKQLSPEDQALLQECLDLEALEYELNSRREVRTTSARRLIPRSEELEQPEQPRLARSFSRPRHRAGRGPRSAPFWPGIGLGASSTATSSWEALPQEAGLPVLSHTWSATSARTAASGSTRRSPPRTPRVEASSAPGAGKADLFIIPSAVPPQQAKPRKKEARAQGLAGGLNPRGRSSKTQGQRRDSSSSSSSSSSASSRGSADGSDSGLSELGLGRKKNGSSLASSCLKKVKYPWDPILDDNSKPVARINSRKNGSSKKQSSFSSWLSKQPWRQPTVNILKILHREEEDSD